MWPASEARPAHKQTAVEYLRKHAAMLGTWSFQKEKAGIQIHGDIAITHFILRRTVDSDAGASVKHSSRGTRTESGRVPMEDPWRHECRIQVINQRSFSYAQRVL